jgi:hypothetical protein
MTATEKRIYFFRKISQLVEMAFIEDIALMPFRFYETYADAKLYFLQGKSQIDPDKHSTKHQLWLAIDLVIVEDGLTIWTRNPKYEWLGKTWKELTCGKGKWGGFWKGVPFDDIFHYELGEME